MKISIESGKVTDEGLVEVPKRVYDSMGLKPGSEVDFIAVPLSRKSINPRALELLRRIRSARRKPSQKLIEQVIAEVRQRSTSRKYT